MFVSATSRTHSWVCSMRRMCVWARGSVVTWVPSGVLCLCTWMRRAGSGSCCLAQEGGWRRLMCSGSWHHNALRPSSSAPGLNSRPASQAKTLPGALRRSPGSWGSWGGFRTSFDTRDTARALRIERPHTAQVAQIAQAAQTATANSRQTEILQISQSKVKSNPDKSEPGETGRSICELTAKRLAVPGPQCQQGGRLQKIWFFMDKIVISPGSLADGTTLDFARIGHAELDGKTCSLKLRVVAPDGSQRFRSREALNGFPAGYLQIELEQSDFDTLRCLAWPLLLRAVFSERSEGAAAKPAGPPRGPSLVWSHA